ncbi:MAG: 16S rRNA (cytosine(1402)-N(4))-methyltransferase RsmH [Myxococcales bacterium]
MVIEFAHETVLLKEAVEAIAPRDGGVYVDATLGGAGHSRALLEACGPTGKLFGIDRDPLALSAAAERLAAFGPRATLLRGSFGDIRALLASQGVSQVDGIVADLGVSSPQLDRDERGFSFARSGPLDMRMDPEDEPLSDWLERMSADEIADVLYQYGDERRSRPIARSIKAALERGELTTTEDLRRAVVRVLGPKRTGVDPATRTFQALRIMVNREFEQLESLLGAAADLLADEGRLAIISFHSGEDRIVKHTLRENPELMVLTKKPLEPSEPEQAQNPRARSAKLRVASRVARGKDST